MPLSAKTSLKSTSCLKSFTNKLKNLEKYRAEAGFYQEQRHPSAKMSMAKLAAMLHEGVASKEAGRNWKIPPRPFLYKAWIASMFMLNKDMEYLVKEYLYGKSNIRTLMKGLADKLAERITVSISGGGDIPYDPNVGNAKSLKGKIQHNAPYTIEKKGFNYPLVDTGLLVSSVKSKVIDKTKGK